MVGEQSADETFDIIHRMLREGELEQAINCVLDRSSGTIRAPYDTDLNHAWYVVGDAYFRKGELASSIAAFDRAIEQWPEDIDALIALANAHSEAKNPTAARNTLLRARAIAPDDARITYNLANAHFDVGDLKDAEALYEEAAKSGDRKIRALANRNLEKMKRRMQQQKSD